jgi:hypothetical protein
MQQLRLSAMLVLTLASALASAEIYKWVDAEGKAHYADRPPSSGAESHSMTLPPAPSKDPDHAERSLKRQRLLHAIETEHAEQQQRQAEASAARRAHAEECEKVRRDLAAFERANIIYTNDAQGGRIYMSDDERREALAEARQWLAKHCD